MSYQIFHLPLAAKQLSLKTLLLTAGLLALLLSSFWAAPATSALPDPADPLAEFCKELDALPKDAKKGCTAANMTRAKNVATYKCDSGASADEKVACVLREAKEFIKAAARSRSPDVTNADTFKEALDKVLQRAGGDASKPAPGFGSINPSGTCSGGTCIDEAADPNAKCDGDRCDFISKYVNPGVNLLSLAFGLIAVISLIAGGIQYSASTGDPQKVSAAKSRIMNTIIAIVAFFFLYAFLQFLVPGGLFNRDNNP